MPSKHYKRKSLSKSKKNGKKTIKRSSHRKRTHTNLKNMRGSGPTRHKRESTRKNSIYQITDSSLTKLTPENLEKNVLKHTDLFGIIKNLNYPINGFTFTQDDIRAPSTYYIVGWNVSPLINIPGKSSIFWVFTNPNNIIYIKKFSEGKLIGGEVHSISKISKYSEDAIRGMSIDNIAQIIRDFNVKRYTPEELSELRDFANRQTMFINNNNSTE